MACERQVQKATLAAAASGGSRQVSRGAHLSGQAIRQAASWMKQNPNQARLYGLLALKIGQTLLKTAQGLAAYRKNQVQWDVEPGGPGQPAFVYGQTTGSVTRQDRQHAETVKAGLDLVSQQVGRPDITQVTIADDLAFGEARFRLTKAALENRPLGRRTYAKVYQALKPVMVGRYFMESQWGQGPVAFTSADSQEIVFNRKHLADEAKSEVFGYGRYLAVHEALHRVPRLPGSRNLKTWPGRLKEEALVDAIAARLVEPGYKGPRSGYDTVRRLADFQACLIAKASGRQPLEVLVRQLKLDPEARPTAAGPAERS